MKVEQKHPEVDYGPLRGLIGEWSGDKGMDVSPEPDGEAESPYFETIVYEEAGSVENAEKQQIAVVRYLQIVKRKSTGEVFHDQTGYWMWDSASKRVMHSLTIPRGLCLVAGGKVVSGDKEDGCVAMEVEARDGDGDWGIVQSPFLKDHARTVSFQLTLKVGERSLTYAETTNLKIYGRDFEHTDANELLRVERT